MRELRPGDSPGWNYEGGVRVGEAVRSRLYVCSTDEVLRRNREIPEEQVGNPPGWKRHREGSTREGHHCAQRDQKERLPRRALQIIPQTGSLWSHLGEVFLRLEGREKFHFLPRPR